MAKGENGQGLLVGVAIAAFVLGRWPAGEAEAPAAEAIPEGFELITPAVEAEPEPEGAPLPLVSHEPSRAHGGRAFANCSEARAAGAAPVYAGDPGYARRLDRDGDGVGCE